MDVQRLFDLLHYQEAHYPQTNALCEKIALGWQSRSTKTCLEMIESISSGGLQLGLKKGDVVGVMLQFASADALLFDLGMQQIGVIIVPLSPTLSNTHLLQIINESQMRYCLVDRREQYQTLQALRSNLLSLQTIFSLEKLPDVAHWTKLTPTPTANQLANIQSIRASLHEEDTATVVYDVKANGELQAVALSHKNLMTNVKALAQLLPLTNDKKVVTYQPLSVSLERLLTYAYLMIGTSVYCLSTLNTISDDLRFVRPHFASASAGLLKKIYQHIHLRQQQVPTWRRGFYAWSLRIGERYPDRPLSFWYWFQWQMASYLLFRHWQSWTGKKLEHVLVTDTTLPNEAIRLFNAARFSVRIAYGDGLTSGLLALNRFKSKLWRVGTAGVPLSHIGIRIDESSGQLWVKGESVGAIKNRTTAAHNDGDWQATSFYAKLESNRFLLLSTTPFEAFTDIEAIETIR